MNEVLANRFYYLDNFRQVLDWVSTRYDDLLEAAERAWIAHFHGLPQASQALLARMVMRKGPLFRSGKLAYDEIGDTRVAALPLIAAGWVDDCAPLNIDQLSGVLGKAELAALLPASRRAAGSRKAALLDALRADDPASRPFNAWLPGSDECVYLLQPQVADWCNRLRLMFFGNLHQDWTEFVLADLGIYRYESVDFSPESRGFRCRGDVDAYLHLHQCRERFRMGEPADLILRQIGEPPPDSDWLAGRHARLRFDIAQHLEKAGELHQARELYRSLRYPGARLRLIRVLERDGDAGAALRLAQEAADAPESDAEQQQLARMLPRLRRKCGQPAVTSAPAADAVDELALVLPRPASAMPVEEMVRAHLARADAPVYVVENALINSLFGLLCWDAVFAAVPGAFFHPFHAAPADLFAADFRQRRQAQFAACLKQLESECYRHTIRDNFYAKAGILSPFVYWGALDGELLELALDCIPADHLRHWFSRMLQDLRNNRSGFPDLVEFRPRERSYRLIEVKGPGDRLQDNQSRLLAFCNAHRMPVTVCYVQWAQEAL
jgi:hypothetical protein